MIEKIEFDEVALKAAVKIATRSLNYRRNTLNMADEIIRVHALLEAQQASKEPEPNRQVTHDRICKVTLVNSLTKQSVEMPKGATIISAKEQHGLLCIFFTCSIEEELEPKTFYIFGIGAEFPEEFKKDQCRFIDTVTFGASVLHIYTEVGGGEPGS